MVDKNFCMSSYLVYRFIEKEDANFFEGISHKNFAPQKFKNYIKCHNAKDIDEGLKENFSKIRDKKIGLSLSGGMDSGILASYLTGCDAYTFRFLGGKFQADELNRAEYYSKTYDLKLHYVDIDFQKIDSCLDEVMKNIGRPVASIDAQIFLLAKQALNDGIEIIITGDNSDINFGGMDRILSRDWNFDDFVKFYTFLNPFEVLENPVDVNYLFERYRVGEKIDYQKFLKEVYSVENVSSYANAFELAGIDYLDAYENLIPAEPLDLKRIRSGETKYFIRELFAMKYPDFPIPEKIPMPRPVDLYFENWQGPVRNEFKKNLDMKKFTGNQKWQLYCLERFLNRFETK